MSKSIIPRYRTSTNWNDASTASGPLWVTRLLNVIMSSGVIVYAFAFVLERTFWAHFYFVDCSNWHLKFPKIVQAHTLGEVGNLGTVLLRVYSGTVVRILIEIGLYLTDEEQNISCHSFFETRCTSFVAIYTHTHMIAITGVDLNWQHFEISILKFVVQLYNWNAYLQFIGLWFKCRIKFGVLSLFLKIIFSV